MRWGFCPQVHYTGLESHPDYDIHMAQASGGGSVVCFRTGSLAFSQHIVTVRGWHGFAAFLSKVWFRSMTADFLPSYCCIMNRVSLALLLLLPVSLSCHKVYTAIKL